MIPKQESQSGSLISIQVIPGEIDVICRPIRWVAS